MASYRSLFLISVCLLVILAGCSFKDIDKRFFVVTVGVDKTKDEQKPYEVSLKLAIPNGSPKMGQEKFVIVSERAASISEAIRLMKAKVDKELDFGHTKAIVLGQGILKSDVKKVTDFFTRRRDIQMIAWMMQGEPSAKAVLKIKPDAERLPSNSIFLSFGQTGTESPYITSTYLFDFRRKLFDDGIDPVIPIVKAEEKKQMLTIRKAAVVNGERYLLLTKDETRLLNVLSGRFSNVDISVRNDKAFFLISATRSESSYVLHADGENPYIAYTLKVSGIIEESSKKLYAEDLEAYSKMAESVVAKRVQALLEHLQAERVDPIGFGMRYRARHTDERDAEVQAWKHLYPKLKFQVHVDVNITSTGLTE